MQRPGCAGPQQRELTTERRRGTRLASSPHSAQWSVRNPALGGPPACDPEPADMRTDTGGFDRPDGNSYSAIRSRARSGAGSRAARSGSVMNVQLISCPSRYGRRPGRQHNRLRCARTGLRVEWCGCGTRRPDMRASTYRCPGQWRFGGCWRMRSDRCSSCRISASFIWLAKWRCTASAKVGLAAAKVFSPSVVSVA